MTRKPSCLISCSQPGPLGGFSVDVGEAGLDVAGTQQLARQVARARPVIKKKPLAEPQRLRASMQISSRLPRSRRDSHFCQILATRWAY
jgi:hypothetical protein